MEVQGYKSSDGLLAGRERHLPQQGETTIPLSGKEYLELPLEERMLVATAVLQDCASNEIDEFDTTITADITPEDEPNVILKGAVGYVTKTRTVSGISTFLRGIQVQCIKHDTVLSVELEAVDLGGVRYGNYLGRGRKTQTGWHVWDNENNYQGYPLSEPQGRKIVRFIDAAVADRLGSHD